ncbi:unnamed protein product [Owenia fusiformis]|uniref:lysozyme n=1 Tax=Owenia fusiformis TaxID=6347 RepID=A0A8S4PTD2_OWEFU|nr:unnamed protein product [Owenia fusiformis]
MASSEIRKMSLTLSIMLYLNQYLDLHCYHYIGGKMKVLFLSVVILYGLVGFIKGDTRCRAVNGYCQFTSTRCDGTYSPGMCNGPANRQCCRPSANADRNCAARGGTCKYGTCTGGNFIPNLCPGPADRRCCVGLRPPPRGDARCTSRQGRCQPRSNRCSPGGYVSGLCTGSNVCCMGRQFQRCELVRALRARNMPGNLADWMCLAYHESRFRTYAVGRPNSNGSQDWGLYQVNDNYWCKSNRNGRSNNCGLYCWDVLKADITDSTNCAKIVYRAQGFRAWSAWRNQCRGRDLSAYVRGC